MPGSSLWLVPPPTHPLHKILTDLITNTLPNKFPEHAPDAGGYPQFPPHMTLTSEVSPSLYNGTPQAWLDSIPWPAAGSVKVRFGSVKSQDTFFRRCYISVGLGGGVEELAGLARARGVNDEEDANGPKTKEWLKRWVEAYGPHVSLIYGDKPIDDKTLDRVAKAVEDAGIKMSATPENTASEDQIVEEAGWDGGEVWLVPTDKPIEQWKPIATREL
ncbi:2',3'-cyclic-nucleotide 3'-phosphodiesterase [Diplogelasinospora grovesii]|uniref:2',3'-cyclic-nucleotide 3'-phosphodiesterase n=1 Tax=Diplogelasinospora grovesii TaxID=303347 RepID=A0AAN6N1E3_9PEZI|nr:2',3'-cyclic-nucleotide 3'-phosphodiesterase [Diplogelasinospora grovesii]